ncbi:MAG: SET domain-containing protein-lysine N-methyltransferase [Saprospiraceae bacterium]|nr:SET domain-containing protein-lysine N-methyltransferase [Saprospiraceae bacterium]
MQHIPGLYVGTSPLGGRGVFSAHDVSEGDIVEICPLLFIPPEQLDKIDKTIFYDYYYAWPGDEGYACIALGYGSLYNHSFQPNADIIFDLDDRTIVIKALKEILAHDEILIDYQGGDKNATKLWFDVK